MANLTVNRMTLINKRNSRRFANRGSELLQAKRNALLLELQKTRKMLERLQEKMEGLKGKALESFTSTVAIDGYGAFPFARSLLQDDLKIGLSTRNIFGTSVAVLEEINSPIPKTRAGETVSSRLHAASSEVTQYMKVLIEYSILWSKSEKIKKEIKKTNRRLNFLCLKLIPGITEEIKYIELGLESRELEEIVKQKKLKKRKRKYGIHRNID